VIGGILAAQPSSPQAPPAAQASPAAGPISAIQAASTPPAKAPDYSNESYVVEKYATIVTCEDDGACTNRLTARVHVQSTAGVQAFGELGVSYSSAVDTAAFIAVKVSKPDGTVVTTDPAEALEVPADVTRAAPEYSDLEQKRLAVRGLEVGDTLDYETLVDEKVSLAPGQFWCLYNFLKGSIVLQEDFQFIAPRSRHLNVASPAIQPTVTEQGDNRIYEWKTAELSQQEKTKEADEPQEGRAPPPDIMISSFESWDAVGQWFRGLAEPRAEVTPDIKAKADALTAGAKTDAEKIQILYNFVSTKFRYIGISLGVARYQPHFAAEVLTNGFGDCKDKHTLLSALLRAEGITAYPVLINTRGEMDTTVPSPMPFDHVITAIPQGDGYLFLDATPEVAPFGYLSLILRDKKALLIPDKSSAQIVSTPASLPFPSFFNFSTDATLDADGTLKGKMQLSVRGDNEIPVRAAFRQTDQPQWVQLIQQLSQALDFAGTVSDVTASSPESTSAPFVFGYNYTRENYSDWDEKQITPPLPPIDLVSVPDGADAPTSAVRLGVSTETYTADVKLPEGANPKLPPAVDLKNNFADYQASYSFADGVLHAQRREIVKVEMLNPAQFDAYREFVLQVTDDESHFFPVFAPAGFPSAASSSPSDTSGSADARQFFAQALDAQRRGDRNAALQSYQEAVAADPKYAAAWLMLGDLHANGGDVTKGVEDVKKAIDLDPSPVRMYTMFAMELAHRQKNNEALDVLMEIEKSNPTDPQSIIAISGSFLALKLYNEALQAAEAGVKNNPKNVTMLLQVAEARIHTGNPDGGVAAIEQAVAVDSSPGTLNDASYTLGDNNLKLDESLQWAQKSVTQLESDSAAISLDDLAAKDKSTTNLLSATWDTLGWIEFRLGHYDLAAKYCLSAWSMYQDSTVADHLGQIYEKMGRKRDAIQAYQWSLDAQTAPEQTAARLKVLTAGAASQFHADPGVISLMRTVTVARVLKEHASAEFFLLLAPGSPSPKVVGVKFVSGSDELKNADAAIESAKFSLPFPDDGPTRLLLHGILDCEPDTGCSIVLVRPDADANVD
jgi:tetratricopeptide (TPR) repeat protein